MSNLSRSFVTRAALRRVHALARRNRKLLRFFQRYLAITLGIGISHVGKARAQAFVIRTSQRILSLKIDVISKDNQRALSVLHINSASSIGENQSARANSPQHARGKGHLGSRVALIKMHPSLHHGNGNAAALADHELSGMPNRRRTRKGRDVSVGNADSFSKVVGKSSETRAEDEPDLRPKDGLRQHKGCCGFGASKQVWGHWQEFIVKELGRVTSPAPHSLVRDFWLLHAAARKGSS